MSTSKTFDSIHRAGAKRHPRTWVTANMKAVQNCGVDVSIPANKVLIAGVVLRVLDAVSEVAPESRKER